MKFINNMPIKMRLLLMVIPPLLIITVHSILAMNNMFNEKENLESSKSRILEVESLAKAIHYLQVERGLSIGFTSSNGAKNGDMLLDTRAKLDSAIDDIKAVYTKTHGDSLVLNTLDELNNKRSSIDSLSVAGSEIGAYFTNTIVSFIDAAVIIPTLMNDADGRNTIQAYTHLASTKESLGQIRALLNQAFITNAIDSKNYALLIGRELVHTTNKRKFQTLAPVELQKFYNDTFMGENVKKTFEMIDIVKEKGVSGNFGVNSSLWFTTVTASIDLLREVELELYKYVYSAMDEKINTLSTNIIITIAFVIFFIIAGIIMSIFLTKNILSPLSSIQQGLSSFFLFLNRESSKTTIIKLNSKDEFGQMAKIINENIERTRKGIEEDRRLIDETISVLGEFEQGDLCQRLKLNVSNPALMQLKNVLNNMASNLEKNIENVLKVLEEYSSYNYLKKVDEKGLKEHLLKLSLGVNTLGDAITGMLKNSLKNGIDMQNDASSLKQIVESLSTASNQQAASLEETAAAMEEMTSNVQNNTSKTQEMSDMAKETDIAAKEGAILASKTASAMVEIQSATASINDAVVIIENIAFQTNILSLNAAVEAATAGDAGKGFAVVAQEVRNLANRSAEAAKQIKEMALQASQKSDEGMSISQELTAGFEVIAKKIEQTTMLVQDVSSASREQMQGIGQINTAVTQLDQMTQENAKVAAKADSIAEATINKARAMVEDASSKEFVGKSDIRASQTNSKEVVKKPQTKETMKQPEPKRVSSKPSSDVWESF